ncbi:Constitutive coactivator of peroxisome proliferator-activated receptor gamma [Araneus ventricosus]|uniref:Constitutive coactivator of peroxisome proliferator-activated receptor gamma n=1 Tax=Araneus ventricosus TaxID=182803 RepID=A0A4Y2CA85_ARAVE|nr:Constitutive coactivator of peroxisome proliferator-activated receptor gamma [Araneus ventricosus]
MGVRGLQSFIENECPEACKRVSIKELAEKHREIFNVEPVLVVDGLNWLVELCVSLRLEWMYGGQWLQIQRAMAIFIAAFKSIGVKLVFIFDGTICKSKRNEWVRRRTGTYEAKLEIFKMVKMNYSEPFGHFGIPTLIDILSCFIVKGLGADAFQTDTEADFVIAEYATKNKEVFAVLTQDSDFIIFNTKMYLSSAHLDFATLSTIHYDRDCLASQYLHLPVERLPLFACLVGNDFIHRDLLREFHLSLAEVRNVYVAAVAEKICSIIKNEGWKGHVFNWHELSSISLKVFGNRTDGTHLIREGLKSYAINCNNPRLKVQIKVSPELENIMYERHYNCMNAPYIFDLLCKMEFSQREVLEDASRTPCALVYREVRQRCYGVLFNCYVAPHSPTNPGRTRTGEEIIVKEWCAYQGNFLEKPEFIKPLPLKVSSVPGKEDQIPTIDDLWFNSTEKEKLWMFWRILQIPMKFEFLIKLHKDQVVLACVLSSLIGGLKSSPLVQPLEVATFVAQSLWKKKIKELENLPIPWLDPANVNLCTLFLVGVSTVFLVLSTCGSPFSLVHVMPWRYFDGKLFHYLYNKATIKPSIHDLCRDQEETIKEFYKLLRIVTSNTMYDIDKFNWKHIFEDFEG